MTATSDVQEPVRSTPEKPLLEIRDLQVAFGSGAQRVDAVRGVDVTVYPGQTVAIVGESGSGKSTTAHAVIGLLPAGGRVLAGHIRFGGKDLTALAERDLVAVRGNQIGLVPQDPMSNLNPVWRIGFQLTETLAANGVARGRAARKKAVALLTEAGVPDAEQRMHQYPHELSGGLRQRVLIAIALSCRPELLIADEPTSALDVTVQQRILDHIDGLTSRLGTAMLLITHDLGVAAERAEHIVVMYRGRVVESGPAQEILRDPQHEYTQRLVDSAPSLRARVEPEEVAERGHGGDRESASQILRARVEPEEVPPEPRAEGAVAKILSANNSGSQTGSEDMVVAEGLTKRYRIRGSVPWRSTVLLAADGVSFRVRRGTTTAIVGESGSGKSTVAQVVLGLTEPSAGSVSVAGTEVRQLCRDTPLAFRRQVQPIFQNPYGSLDPMYSIHRTLLEPLRTHRIGSRAEREVLVRKLLDQVALPASVLSRYPNELSGGQRQRVAIARALAPGPQLLICDEAVSALDVLVQAQILDLLRRLQAELGLTYVFISHDLAVVREIADQVVVMRQGQVVESADTATIFDHPQQEYTQALLAAIPGQGVLT